MSPIEPNLFTVDVFDDWLRYSDQCCCECGSLIPDAHTWVSGSWRTDDNVTEWHNFNYCNNCWDVMEVCAAISCELDIDMPEITKLADYIYKWSYTPTCGGFTKHEGKLLNMPSSHMQEMIDLGKDRMFNNNLGVIND